MTVALQDWETFTGTNTPVVGAAVNARVASTSHPNAGAIVASTTTGSNGQWSFAALADNTYDVDITYNSRVRHRKGLSKFSNAISGSNFATQTANQLFVGPTSGGAATPTFRAMVTADVPDGVLTAPKFANQTANTAYRGPSSGGAAAPTFRAAVLADMPALSLVPGFFAFNSTSLSISNGSTVQVTYDTEDYDNLSNFNLSTDVFIAPVAGVYLIGFGHVWDATIAVTKRIVGVMSVNG